ncbi:conserved hypothetical protein [Paecilomyces variotii No. 5]|uniref:Major facilitator superfamily (MFS) profile domain-containing protein n=1 Tax=Byssochlamys spectabilis (strain No. 5 / NBRC 109023) TaxID=1356009 RepID=V5FTG7_BYSSN|nr:conserved hypothetical protein [Paecilomyces variotii No. 5]
MGPENHHVELQWDSVVDSRNPHNWPGWKRLYHTVCVALFAFTITYMSSAYAIGAAQTAQEFGVSQTVSLLGVSLFCLGLSLGPVLGAPLSETFGRLTVYRAGFPITVLFLIGSAVGKSIGSVLTCRFFAGLFGSPALSVGGGTIADIWPPSRRGPATYLFVAAPFLGPCLAPVVGGFLVERMGWRWLEWVSVFLGVGTCVFALGMRETYKEVILRHHSEKKPGSVKPVRHYLSTLRNWMALTMLRPMKMLVSEPIVLFLSLYVGFNFAVLYAFFASIPLVFAKTYNFSDSKIGLTFVALGIGVFLATLTSILCDKLIYQPKARRALSIGHVSSLPPENRLYPAVMGSLGTVVGLFWFAWTARSSVFWLSPVAALIPFNWGNLCIFSTTIVYIIDCYGPQYGASALSANAFTRYVLAAAFPLFTDQMYNSLTIPWATSLLGFVAVAMVPIPWILLAFGPKIRSWSRLAHVN